MPKFILDGKEIEFTPGQTIIQAATAAGMDIPHFCWHESLSISGNCRVCLVEVEKMPKLVIACSTTAAEGMVVHSQSEKSLAARSAVMEFILINHPLDCPICDEAGECKLQDYAYQHSNGESRFNETKNHKDKRVELGPHVMFDGERCISCSRCIRFCDEIAQDNQLTFVKRGDRVTITTFPGKTLDNPYSLNVTDICPVGALTNRDFRFKSRVWEMSATKSVCPGCARGCNTDIWVRGNEILRLTPRQNDAVNSFWMCDKGRLETFKNVAAESRVIGPNIRRDGELTKVTWDEAYSAAVSELRGFSKEEIAFIGSPFATCEDNYLLNKFVKTVFGKKHMDIPDHTVHGAGDSLLIREDKSPNALGARLTGINPAKDGYDFEGILNAIKNGRLKALYVLEDNLLGEYPDIEEYLVKLDVLIIHAVNFDQATKYATVVFPAASYAEKNGVFVNFLGRAQRIRPAVALLEKDRSLDGFAHSRLDKFGTPFDRWGSSNKVDARPSWKILSGLLTVFGHKQKYTMAEEVFHEISESIPEFHGIDYDAIGEAGVQLSGIKQNIIA
jgi:NADH-quinone oxidoreductase subunit G